MLDPQTFTALGASPTMVLAQTDSLAPRLMAPGLLFLLCAIGAVGLILLLPGRREGTLRRIGGVVLAAAAIIFAALLAKSAAGMGAYFWIFSAIAILGAVRVITHPRAVYSALYFVLTVMASAGLFVLMWAEFMAAALILIYAGAILVTYVFVIMLASEAQPAGEGGTMAQQLAEHDTISREPILASAVGFALLGMLMFVIFDGGSTRAPGETASGGTATLAAATTDREATLLASATTQRAGAFQPVGQTQRLGAYLFENQMVNLELAGLILTIAMVGAIVIARKRVVSVEPAFSRRSRDALTAPMTPIDDNPHSIPVYGTENPRQKEYPET